MSRQEELEATPKQRIAIAKLAQSLGIGSPIEEGYLTMAQAGRQIRHLSAQLKLRGLGGLRTTSRKYRR